MLYMMPYTFSLLNYTKILTQGHCKFAGAEKIYVISASKVVVGLTKSFPIWNDKQRLLVLVNAL